MARRGPVVTTGGASLRSSARDIRSDRPRASALRTTGTAEVEGHEGGVWGARCVCGWRRFYASHRAALEAANEHWHPSNNPGSPPLAAGSAVPATAGTDSGRVIRSGSPPQPRSARTRRAPSAPKTKGARAGSARGATTQAKRATKETPPPPPPSPIVITRLSGGWSVRCRKCSWPGASSKSEEAATRLAGAHRCK